MMRYRGYVGSFEQNPTGRGYEGHITNITDEIMFRAIDPDGLEKAFKNAVDAYLEQCKTGQKKFEKPYSGFIMLRIDPAMHRAAAEAARKANLSLSRFVIQCLEQGMRRKLETGKRSRS